MTVSGPADVDRLHGRLDHRNRRCLTRTLVVLCVTALKYAGQDQRSVVGRGIERDAFGDAVKAVDLLSQEFSADVGSSEDEPAKAIQSGGIHVLDRLGKRPATHAVRDEVNPRRARALM